MTGYAIQGRDDSIGHLEDLILDDRWTVRYLVVDTRNWWPGRETLLLPALIEHIDWDSRQVLVGATRDQIQLAPEWDPDAALDRESERRVHQHYGVPPYWSGEPVDTSATFQP